MKFTTRPSVVFALALFAATVASAGSASAESIIRAIYHINLTDGASGTMLNTSRLSVRSWPNIEQCKTQSGSGAGFHVKAVEGYGIKDSADKALAVKLASVKCFVVSE